MEIQQLVGRYYWLKRELSCAYSQQPRRRARVDRLAIELTDTERKIEAFEIGPKIERRPVPSNASTSAPL